MNPIKPIAIKEWAITDKFGFCEQCGGDRECPATRPSIKEWM